MYAIVVLTLLLEPVSKQTVHVPMRDGIKLTADVYLPSPAQKRPVLLMRTPYNKTPVEPTARRYAEAGYAVMVQDCRGRYASEGVFFPYNNEGQDGFDTLEWIKAQPWSDGRTGMWGASYVGAVQWQAAAERAPGLAVVAPTATWSSFYRNVYAGGAVRLALIAQAAASTMPPPDGIAPPSNWADTLMHLPLATMEKAIGWPLPWLTGILTHPNPDGFWKRLDIGKDIEGLDLPAQHIVGYYDFFSREEVANFERMRTTAAPAARRKQQLILGPWDHGTIGKSKVADVDFGPNAQLDLTGENLVWFNRFLRGDHTVFPPVRYFTMGDNQWRTAQSWPPEYAKLTRYYLRSNGKANTRAGDGRLSLQPPHATEPPDVLKADPADPAPAIPAGAAHPKYSALWGPVDQGSTADRPDVLVYRTEPLTTPLAFAGPIRAELHVSADVPDADWVVKLVDVRPDGFAQQLAVGLLRSSARESDLYRQRLEPGRTYRLTVDVGSTAATILPGHTLRVDVSAAYFPLFDRNPNTGEGPASARTRIATQKVLHAPAALSAIWLPIIPVEKGPGR
jgi:putative CocE/NonD family hydrolase